MVLITRLSTNSTYSATRYSQSTSGSWTSPTNGSDRFLLELMELRYDNASTAFTTQLATKEWRSRLGGDTIADAILDRIVHNTVWIDTGESDMRQRHGQSMLES